MCASWASVPCNVKPIPIQMTPPCKVGPGPEKPTQKKQTKLGPKVGPGCQVGPASAAPLSLRCELILSINHRIFNLRLI